MVQGNTPDTQDNFPVKRHNLACGTTDCPQVAAASFRTVSIVLVREGEQEGDLLQRDDEEHAVPNAGQSPRRGVPSGLDPGHPESERDGADDFASLAVGSSSTMKELSKWIRISPPVELMAPCKRRMTAAARVHHISGAGFSPGPCGPTLASTANPL